MNYLKDKNVYLAGPIAAVADDGCGWRDFVTPRLVNDFELYVEDPCKKTANGQGEVKDDKAFFKQLVAGGHFDVAREKFWPIVRKDLRCVDKADFLIVYYDPLVHMFGTVHEIVLAHQQKKPILVKYDKENLDKFNIWLCTLAKPKWLFDDWDKMFNYLDLIKSGTIDTEYWTL